LLPVFNYTDNLASAVEYFENQLNSEDIIQFLQYQVDDLDMSVSLNENYDAEPTLLKKEEIIIVEETYATKTVFTDAISYYADLVTDVIERIQQYMKTVQLDTESACNSPPIRAPGYAA
jgi:hypothetical protein